ncbi:hypothetical protein DPMN_137517 [Dreissena polymorpha]|uniref:Uncharacterized protein n=1 Tax=Dreissena polymorpha TaxID=45954 RepID=A0A9D4G5E7_DREPO|nr:hypothetical protein DPMN_137517 [Dreissena polymorpha]
MKQDRGQLECALDCLKPALRRLKGRRISFLCGDAGPLALGAVVHEKLGNAAASVDCIKRSAKRLILSYYQMKNDSITTIV